MRTVSDGLASVATVLRERPASPWVFGLYSRLVAELSRGEGEAAVPTAGSLVGAGSASWPSRVIVPLLAGDAPPEGWEQFGVLFDTDPRRTFRLRPPDAATFDLRRRELDAALALLERAAPDFAAEVAATIRMIVLASPANGESDFNGASTFFMWGAVLFNAETARRPARFCDLLVHEASHLLLFGRSANAPLTENRGDERLDSPLRRDKRPVDGIFHACFVATRVHRAMADMLAGGRLRAGEVPDVTACLRHNGEAARKALATLAGNARLTPLGEEVFGELTAYWADQAAPAAEA